MSRKWIQEEFLKNLYEKNSNYKNGEFSVISDYKNYDTSIYVLNNKGICEIPYECLMYRNSKPSILSAVDKTDYFKKELLEVNESYRKREFEIVDEYAGRSYKMKVSTKYGYCRVSAYNLLKGWSPTTMSAINKEDYFSEMLRDINPNVCKKVNKVVKFNSCRNIEIDTIYGDIVCSTSILEWKDLSIKSAKNKKEFWVRRCEYNRGDFNDIDYSKANYINNNCKVLLCCKKHQHMYEQRPSHHMAGIQGCPYCMEQTIMYNEENIKVHENFLKNIDGFLYVVKLWSEDESFYKIGICAKHRIKYRMNQLKLSYDLIIEYIEDVDMVSAYKLEQMFLEEFKSYKYVPKIKFKGYTECLTTNPVWEYYHWFNNR